MQSPRLEDSCRIDFCNSYCGQDESLDNSFQGCELLKLLLCISVLEWWWMLFSSAQNEYLYLSSSSPVSWRSYLQIWEHTFKIDVIFCTNMCLICTDAQPVPPLLLLHIPVI